jgi:hypothetical protein
MERQAHRFGYEEATEEMPHAEEEVPTHASQASIWCKVHTHQACHSYFVNPQESLKKHCTISQQGSSTSAAESVLVIFLKLQEVKTAELPLITYRLDGPC